MNAEKKEQLEKKGWVSTSVQDFLELTHEETAYIEMKLRLSAELKSRRKEQGLTQTDLAGLINSSQSRVAKMEKSDPTVSIDLLARSFFALGATVEDMADVLVAA